MIVGYDSRTGGGELAFPEAISALHTVMLVKRSWHESDDFASYALYNFDGGYLGTLTLHHDWWELTKPGV